jgi:hypothetical protein
MKNFKKTYKKLNLITIIFRNYIFSTTLFSSGLTIKFRFVNVRDEPLQAPPPFILHNSEHYGNGLVLALAKCNFR